MIHDEEYLRTFRHDQPDTPTHIGIEVIAECKAYHEHMMTWRPITETPTAGMWIEVLCNELGDIHTITYGPGRFKDTDIGWRPAAALPDKGVG